MLGTWNVGDGKHRTGNGRADEKISRGMSKRKIKLALKYTIHGMYAVGID